MLFRVLLFKVFNRIDTWELLTRHLDATPGWAGYDFRVYRQVLDDAIRAGKRIYSPAYIVPNPPFGEARKHGNHLRLIELAMTRLPDALTAARSLRGLYELLAGLPSLGPFLAYQYAIDINYSAVATADENEFIVPGPGALDGSSKCFTSTGGLHPADVITWMRDTSPEHFPPKWRLPPDRTAILPNPLNGPAKIRPRAARSPRRIPPPCSQTVRRHPIPVRMACSHSSRVLTDTSRP